MGGRLGCGMTADVVLWILGVAVAVLFAVFGYIVSWNNRQDTRMGEIEKAQSQHSRHTAENYVRGHEIAEVKKVVADLRTELNSRISEMSNELSHQISELIKAVYQNIGSNSK